MISISGAVSSITAALDTIKKNRARRIGSWTTRQFWDELVRQNKQIKAAVDEKHAGPLRAQKALWFNYRILIDEIANISAVFNVVEQLLDESVLEEIQAKGFDRNKAVKLIEEGKKMLEKIKSDVAVHENGLAGKVNGAQISDDSLNQIEYRIAGSLNCLEDSILKTMPEVIGRISSHSEKQGMTRRGILGLFAKGAAAALVLGAASVVNSAAYGQETKASDITDAEIAEHMKKATVEEILRGASVEYVKYDPATKATNYDALVFQKHLKAEERKPVLVFFYHNKDPPGTSETAIGVGHRSAVVFIKLAQEFKNKVRFVCHNMDVDPELAKDNYSGIRRNYDIRAPPSIAMYSLFDILKGETAQNNNGIIKQIDVMRGGPAKDNKYIIGKFINCRDYWIPTNLLMKQSPEKDNKVYRHNNEWKLKPVIETPLLAKE